MPDLNLKTLDLDIVKRTLTERLSRGVLNTEVEVAPYLDYVIVHMTQRILQRKEDETIENGTKTATDTQTLITTQDVPADWWSHLLVSIVNSNGLPGWRWRWALLRRAKWRPITVTQTDITNTTHTQLTSVYRQCPHLPIQKDQYHMHWLAALPNPDYWYRP